MPSRITHLLARGLIAYRVDRNVSQEEAAHLIGCSIPTYRTLEHADPYQDRLANPRLSTLMQALTLLGLDAPLVHALKEALEDPEGSAARVGDI